jgi:hypothetical protein
MSTWHLAVLFAMAVGVIVCLLGIYRAVEQLAKGIFSLEAELKRMNAKLTSVETVNRDESGKPANESEPDSALEALEAAISNFEKLKRVDLPKPE